ncbi:S8 family serine peptidase [uncultured Psychroserpens sp.]|uniref:S8 family serine peptidase n=1 Tax=uncultured Psychroserpens sp. TaxID=255436 RepID=UPI002612C7B3|nr:S8 family serine peptidase [uncultured Psychroserpens sp.]
MKKRVKNESEFEFYDKLTKKKRSFKANRDQMVVSLNASEMDSLDVLDDKTENLLRSSKSVNMEMGFAIVEAGDSDADSDAMDRDSLLESDYAANSLPSMIDEEGNLHYFMPDEFTVQFDEDVSETKAKSIIKSFKCEIIKKQRTKGYYTLSVPKDKGLFETISAFNKHKDVLFSEASEIGLNDELYVPNDTDFSKLWGLRNIGQTVDGVTGTNDADIDATLAWNYERGRRNVIVAVIDTGVDYNHPDLKNNILAQGSEDWNFASSTSKDPFDGGTHGTHVAGTAAGVDNQIGIIGVAPKCSIMPLRVNLTSGMNSNRADAINYVTDQARANSKNRYVINCSWRMSGHHSGVYMAIRRAVRNNVVVVFAAGNAGNDINVTPQYPAVYTEVIAVAATDQKDRKASFSNYGKKVDVSAPGVNIYSTVPGSNYSFKNGTSMAAPHVAGLAALIWSKNMTLTDNQVRKIIEKTTDNIDAKNPGFVGKLGTGRINAFKALRATPYNVTRKLIKTFSFPQNNRGSSTGLTYARRIQTHPIPWFPKRSALLFVTQKAGSEKIYYLNPITGSVMKAVDPPANDTLGSLTWDGSFIYGANVTTGAGKINKFTSFSGSAAGSINVPAGRGEGLVAVGSYFYYSTISRIYKIRKSNGQVVHSFPAPGGACHSIAYGDGFLFFGNTNNGKVTILKLSNLSFVDSFIVPGTAPRRVDGLAYNPYANLLYVANQKKNKISVLKISF